MSNARNLANLLGTDTKIKTADIADEVFNSNRNLVINGAMQVAQRATSESSLSTFDKFPCVDRFKLQGASSGTFTISQSTTAPEGFSNSLKFDCTTADSSPNYLLIMQRIEGQNLQHLKKGTSNALSTTVSFYVRSSKTGTYQFNIRDNDNTRLIGSTYTINSADTWERKTLTFAGDTSGTLGNDNGDSLRLEWWLAAGSTYNSGAVPTAWEALSNGDRAAGLTVNIGASTSDDFYLTGIQLEVGEQATPFQHEDAGTTLRKCQRYFQKSYNSGTALGASTGVGAIFSRIGTAVSNQPIQVVFPVPMRSSPTGTIYSLVGTSGSVSDCGTSYSHDHDEAANISGTIGQTGFSKISGVSMTAGNMYAFQYTMDAEL